MLKAISSNRTNATSAEDNDNKCITLIETLSKEYKEAYSSITLSQMASINPQYCIPIKPSVKSIEIILKALQKIKKVANNPYIPQEGDIYNFYHSL